MKRLIALMLTLVMAFSLAATAQGEDLAAAAQAVIDGKMPAIPYIFRVKNNYADYSDRNETTIKLDDPLGKKTAPENLLATITEDVIDVEFSESDLSDG